MNDKIKDICSQAISGKISFEAFYDKLSAVCDDTRTDDDAAISDCRRCRRGL